MAITTKISGILSHDETVDRHAKLGWQCPDCYGVRIKALTTRFDPQPVAFECQECGAVWGSA